MTAADRPSVPQVGDTITTADQLDALPVGVVMRARNDLLMETGRLASGDRVVWGEGWSDHADAIEHFAPLTVLYVPGDRPSVTDNARAEAWRRFPDGIDVETGEPVDDYGYPETAREAFMAGVEWAAGRAETTTEAVERIARQIAAMSAMTGRDALELVEAVQALQDAETTTATDEDALVEQVRQAMQDAMNAHGPISGTRQARHMYDALATAGLLATARTRPTREQIARALDRAGAFCGECGAEPGDFFDSCLECQRWLLNYADAVLALLGGDDRG